MSEESSSFKKALKRVIESTKESEAARTPQRAFTKSLEWDLCHLREKLESGRYAEKIYCALCNNEWMNAESGDVFSCSWRRAGEIVAYHRPFNECYLDFYVSMNGCEGKIDSEVAEDMMKIGWIAIKEDKDDPSVKESLEESAKIIKDING